MRMRFEASTLDEAINNAMIELQLTSDKICYDIIQNGATGFLGLGSKPFIIEAYSKDDKEEMYKSNTKDIKDNKLVEQNGVYEFKSNNNKYNLEKKLTRNKDEVFELAKKFLDPIFKEFNLDVSTTIDVKEDTNTMIINISGEKTGILIGKHGQTLDALQHLTNIYVNANQTEKIHIRIDSENYRDKRYKTIENIVKDVVNIVRKTKRDYELEPMSSYERRIVHSVLQKEKNIETISVGKDKNRHVVVKYKRY